MLQLAFRSFFFIAVILAYSTGIWRLINDYFRHEFQSFLEQESKANKYILQDPPTATAGSKQAGNQLLHADAPQRSPPLLDEAIVNVGRTFTDRGGREGGRRPPPEGDHQKVTNSISEFSNPIVESSSLSSSSSSTVTEKEGTPPRRNPPASVVGWQKGGEGLPASELQTGPGSGPKMVAVSHGSDGAAMEMAAAEPVIAAEATAEVTDIRPAPGARKQDELGEEESVEDKWISYWQELRQERKDIDASVIPFCSIGAQPSDENPSGALWPQGEAADGARPSACGSGGK